MGYLNRVTGNADGHNARAMTITVKEDRIRMTEVVYGGGAKVGEVQGLGTSTGAATATAYCSRIGVKTSCPGMMVHAARWP